MAKDLQSGSVGGPLSAVGGNARGDALFTYVLESRRLFSYNNPTTLTLLQQLPYHHDIPLQLYI